MFWSYRTFEFLPVDWALLFLACTASGAVLRFASRDARMTRAAAGIVLVAALSFVAAYVGRYAAVFAMFLYFPARPLTEGPAETMVVWLEAALVVAGAAYLLRRKPIAAIPVMGVHHDGDGPRRVGHSPRDGLVPCAKLTWDAGVIASRVNLWCPR